MFTLYEILRAVAQQLAASPLINDGRHTMRLSIIPAFAILIVMISGGALVLFPLKYGDLSYVIGDKPGVNTSCVERDTTLRYVRLKHNDSVNDIPGTHLCVRPYLFQSETNDEFAINVFANAVPMAPSTFFVESLLSSFRQCLDGRPLEQLNVTIYLHPKPKIRVAKEFARRLRAFGSVVWTNGLLDGYKKSIYRTSTEYAFQLEHDWQFLCKNIHHSAAEIVAAMKALQLDFLKFSKKHNIGQPYKRGKPNPWADRYITSYKTWRNLSVCRNKGRTNNPHVIHVPTYKEYARLYLPKKTRGGRSGIEEVLTKKLGYGFMYGPLGHPPTIGHLNGRLTKRTPQRYNNKTAFHSSIEDKE